MLGALVSDLPRSGCALQPNVAEGYVGLTPEPKQFNRNAVASIPNVAIVPLDLMSPQQGSQLILKVYLAMMVLLVGYVLLYGLKT
jgi:hypothetical protein